MFDKKDFILLATNNGSLYFLSNESRDVVVFASERLILQNLLKKGEYDFIGNYSIEQLFSGRGCTISIDSLEVRKFSLVNTNKDETKCIFLSNKTVSNSLY